MALESCCIPIPSEVVMPYAGYLASQHALSFAGAVIVATLANVLGGLVAYWIGHTGGRAFINRYGRYVLLSPDHVDRAEKWFARRGEWTVLLGRLLPAFRTFISLPAGIAEMSLWRFILYSTLGSLPWNIALTYAGFYLGHHWETVGSALKPLTYGAAVLFVVAILWIWFGRRRKRR
jgi:membrane protein DedA with SNARE-associated domain